MRSFFFDPDPAILPPAGGGAPPVTPPSDWRASLPEDLRSAPSLKDIKGVDDLAKGYVHAQRAIGNNVAVPTKDSTPAEWAAFYNKAGRPEAFDKYDFGKVDGEEKVPLSPEGKKEFMQKAHETGLSNRQAAQLYQWYVGSAAKSLGEHEQSVTQAAVQTEATLKKDWGDAYAQNLDMAKSAVKEFGGDELVKMLNETGLGNDTRLINAFYKIGRGLSEDTLHAQGGSAGSLRMTPAEADATIGQKMSDTDFMSAYMNRDHPGHTQAVESLRKLYAAKHAGT